MKKAKNLKKISIILVLALLMSSIGSTGIFAEEIVTEKTSDETIESEADEELFYEEASEEESVELSGEDEEITEETGVSEEDSAPFEEVEEVMEEDALGLTENTVNIYVGKYDSVSVGQVMKVKPNTGNILDVDGGYIESEDAWFGLARTPEYDDAYAKKTWKDTSYFATAIFKIPGLKNPEPDKEYDGIFLMDVATRFSYDEYPVRGVYIVGDRIYIQPQWVVSVKHEEGTGTRNSCSMELLYSIDTNGGDLRLHSRTASWTFDNVDPNFAATLEEYRYRAYKNGEWYLLGYDGINDCAKIGPSLKELGIPFSQEGLTGFLSPDDEYCNLPNDLRASYTLNARREDGETVEEYEVRQQAYRARSEAIAAYTEKWCVENGFRKSVIEDPSTDTREVFEAIQQLIDGTTNKSISANIIVLPKCTVDVSTYFTTGENKGKNVKYVSSNKKLASVKKNGIVTGKKPGKVKITRRVKSGKTWKDAGYIEVTVYKPDVKVSTKNPMAVRLDYDKTYDMSELVTNKSDVKAVYSAKGSAISMNPDGTFKVLSEGKAKVTIAFGKYKVKAAVVVTP